ncbi:MAG: hypothetical protein QOE92_592 [Chloroflexota bacterium]|jgi:serine protease|nr:hypothetical protein [Chloroflexota bacterium]
MRSFTRKLRAVVVCGAMLGLGLSALQPVAAIATTDDPDLGHLMRTVQQQPMTAFASGAQPPMTYQNAGAPIQAHTTVYLVFWGKQWNIGWTDPGTQYTNVTARNYITSFSQYVSASGWPGQAVSQYCSGVAAGTVNCGGSGVHVGVPITFGGVWTDLTSTPPTPYVPDGCVNAMVCVSGFAKPANLLAKEALRAQTHFLGNGYDPGAQYIIMLPKEATTAGLYCAYHNSVADTQGRDVAYVNMPYTPNLQAFGASLCGENFVNASSNSFGNGYFDGYSMILAHEIAEAMTDPLPTKNSAWRDQAGEENGDMCAWLPPGTAGGAHNIGPDAGGHVYAVQTLWSNTANDCV